MNLNVGQCVSPALPWVRQAGKGTAGKGAGETHCPMLRPAQFRGSKRELLVRGILSPTLSPRFAGGEEEESRVGGANCAPAEQVGGKAGAPRFSIAPGAGGSPFDRPPRRCVSLTS